MDPLYAPPPASTGFAPPPAPPYGEVVPAMPDNFTTPQGDTGWSPPPAPPAPADGSGGSCGADGKSCG
jgi:hypothetical protein